MAAFLDFEDYKVEQRTLNSKIKVTFKNQPETCDLDLSCIDDYRKNAIRNFFDGNLYYQLFHCADDLLRASLPDNINFIEDAVFSYCTKLEHVDIQYGVTVIPAFMFMGCKCLTSVTLPDSLYEIKDEAFALSGLGCIKIPNSVSCIGDCAFECCHYLYSITMPNRLNKLGDAVFNMCDHLESIVVPAGITNVSNHLFKGCTTLRNVVLFDDIVSIGEYTFDGCINLENLNIPNSVKSIGNGAFYNSAVRNITLSDNLEHIGQRAFVFCKNLNIIFYKKKKCNNFIKLSRLLNKNNIYSDYDMFSFSGLKASALSHLKNFFVKLFNCNYSIFLKN